MFPDRSGVRVVGVSRVGAIIRFDAVTREVPQSCPGCGVVSSRVHSRYSREIADVAVAGREVCSGWRCGGCSAATMSVSGGSLPSR
ncbi:transposase family protein [Nocardia sp. NPDC051929]|uniref:transposase family protein n=1 Tax=Nocardia sp. NPDC051929 TaxID=3364327 RepID=UPI0037C712F2